MASLTNLIKLGVGGLVVVGAVLTGSLTSNAATARAKRAGGDQVSSKEEKPAYNPITPEIEAIVDAYDYDFDPTKVVIKEEEEWDFSAIPSNLPTNTADRGDDEIHLVYYFEGSYSEGWQGDYSETYGSLYLWDDGLFGGTLDGTAVKGYWFNSSLERGVDKDGADVKDCLQMVSSQNHYDSIRAESTTGFYHYQAYVYISKNRGRSMIMNGYEYYPECALAINATSTGTDYKVGDKFDRDSWVAVRILKNKSFSAVFKPGEVTWTNQEGMVNSSGNFVEAGEYEVKAKWNGLEASIKVNVTE